MATDRYWAQLLWNCVDRGAFVGASEMLPMRDEESPEASAAMDELAAKLGNMGVATAGDDDADVAAAAAAAGDDEWTEVSVAEAMAGAAWRDTE